jgi:hypothetical protein
MWLSTVDGPHQRAVAALVLAYSLARTWTILASMLTRKHHSQGPARLTVLFHPALLSFAVLEIGDQIMKTSILLFSLAALLGSGWNPSAPLTEPPAVERQMDVATTPIPRCSEQTAAPSTEASPPQTQRVGPWDPNDEFNAADRMLERVREEGVVRIAGVHPSRTRYVFVCEFYAEQQADSTSDTRPKTDLWLVNRDGNGLKRLTESGEGRDPEWSASGAEVLFFDADDLVVVEAASAENRFRYSVCRQCGNRWEQLHWAPNGRAFAALVTNIYDVTWITALRATDGQPIGRFARENKTYEWTPESELLLDTGKFVFDWEAVRSYEPPHETCEDESIVADPPEDPLRDWLIEQASMAGVRDIIEYSLSPSGDRIAFCGLSGEASGPDLWVINRDGGGLRRLATDAAGYGFSWSPSGGEISYIANKAGAIFIAVESGRARHLPFLTGSWRSTGQIEHPVLSANGKGIAAIEIPLSCLDNSQYVVVFDAESGKEILFCDDGVWNDQSELVVMGIGKFVFDWQSIGANRK